MATEPAANTLIRDLIQDVQAHEPRARQKANTVTAVVGTVITTILGLATLVLQSGYDLPEWAVLVVLVAGMVATDFGISQTKNGMTDSTADRLELELARRIDLHHEDIDTSTVPRAESDPHTLRVEADRLSNDMP